MRLEPVPQLAAPRRQLLFDLLGPCRELAERREVVAFEVIAQLARHEFAQRSHELKAGGFEFRFRGRRRVVRERRRRDGTPDFDAMLVLHELELRVPQPQHQVGEVRDHVNVARR